MCRLARAAVHSHTNTYTDLSARPALQYTNPYRHPPLQPCTLYTNPHTHLSARSDLQHVNTHRHRYAHTMCRCRGAAVHSHTNVHPYLPSWPDLWDLHTYSYRHASLQPGTLHPNPHAYLHRHGYQHTLRGSALHALLYSPDNRPDCSGRERRRQPLRRLQDSDTLALGLPALLLALSQGGNRIQRHARLRRWLQRQRSEQYLPAQRGVQQYHVRILGRFAHRLRGLRCLHHPDRHHAKPDLLHPLDCNAPGRRAYV